MSINHLIEISRRSFRALDAAMNTVGHNVANANTDGYTRRRLVLRSDAIGGGDIYSGTMPRLANGIGVSAHSIERLRDQMLFSASLDARSGVASAHAEQRYLTSLEGLFPINSEGSLDRLLSSFWDSWDDLASNPLDRGVRHAVRETGAALTRTINGLDRHISVLATQTTDSMSEQVKEANQLLRRIADLNATITHSRSSGSPDLEAEDERDRVLAKLSEIIPVKAQDHGAEGLTVTMNGIALVQGTGSERIELTNDVPPVLRLAGTSESLKPRGEGKLGAGLQFVSETLVNARNALDTLVERLVERVNSAHGDGYGRDGMSGRDFFAADGLKASNFRLSDDVLADIDAIAASGIEDTPGDNAIARALAALRTSELGGGIDETPGNFIINMIAGIGAKSKAASTRFAGESAVHAHLEAMSAGVSAVSIDEEMTSLIRYQQAYAASARVLNTAQQMMDTLLAL